MNLQIARILEARGDALAPRSENQADQQSQCRAPQKMQRHIGLVGTARNPGFIHQARVAAAYLRNQTGFGGALQHGAVEFLIGFHLALETSILGSAFGLLRYLADLLVVAIL